MAQKDNQQKRPIVQYRVELQKKIEINKSYAERRNQAIAMRILSYGLFGQKRYQNLYLSCSLNCFYYGLKIANSVHRRVAGLAMIIRFEQAHVIEYYAEPFEGKTYGEKKYSKINIKLTKTPTEEDKQQPGYNPGLSAQNIEQPLTDVILRNQRPEGSENRGSFNSRFSRGGRGSYRGGYRRPYGGFRDEGEGRQRREGGYNRGGGYKRGGGERREEGERREGTERREGAERRQGERRDDRQDKQQYRKPRENRQPREGRQTGGMDYRQFKSNRYEQQGNQRGQPKTRGNYQGGPNNSRNERPHYQDDRAFDRRRGYQESEDRGTRGPQRRKYNGDSD